jgi:hypothetical protein
MKLLSELAHDLFLPEPDSPELGPFTRAFMVHMMFAHVEFERRVAEALCAKNHNKYPGGLPEANAIANLLDEAFPICNERNWLAHGVWWRIDTVRRHHRRSCRSRS